MKNFIILVLVFYCFQAISQSRQPIKINKTLGRGVMNVENKSLKSLNEKQPA